MLSYNAISKVFPPMLFRLIIAMLVVFYIARPAWAAEGEELHVVASIQPLALVAEELLGDMGRVEVLVAGAASPHDYALKVSDMRRLQSADLILWMGPQLERFLQKPLRGLPDEKVVALGGEGEHSAAHDDHSEDLHQWLDPSAVQAMARQLARYLAARLPERREEIESRLAAQLAAYETLNAEIEAKLAPYRDRGFVVQHRGYDHFVEAYDLNQIGWLSVNPDQPPGARHLYRLEQELEGGAGAVCVFVEAQHQSPMAANFAEKFQLRIASLDILGNEASSYRELMHNLAAEVANCLAAP